MTMGGFTAIVRVSRSRVASGITDTGEKYLNAEMEMEGKLSVFYYGSLKEDLRSKIKAEAYVQIEFKEYSEENYYESDDAKYIGDIRLRDENSEVIAYLNVILPMSMFSLLKSMDSENIRVETIHDLISNPSDDQKTDSIVALVKRIYFEVNNDLNEEKPRKKFSFSIG